MNLVMQKRISHIHEKKAPVNFHQFLEPEKYQNVQLFEKGQAKAAKLFIKDGMLYLTVKCNFFTQSNVCLELQNMAVQIVLRHPDGQGFSCEQFEIYGINEDYMRMIRKSCIQSDFVHNYEITKKLGNGSFAYVYQANCKYSSGQYAVKVFEKNSSNIQVIKKEINILRTLTHQNIPQLREVFETARFIYIVMDLIQGENLHNIMPVSDKKCQKIMKQIFKILNYLHSMGVIHGDLKPDNILIDKHDKIFIVDFGFAQYANENKIISNKLCGTPGFIAPEVLKGQNFDHKIDIFAVGVIMYTLLTGQYLFVAKQTRDIIILNVKCQFVFDKNMMISQQAKSLLEKILHVDQNQRYTSIEALKHYWIQNEQDNIKITFETIQTQLDEEQDWVIPNDTPTTQSVYKLTVKGRGQIIAF